MTMPTIRSKLAASIAILPLSILVQTPVSAQQPVSALGAKPAADATLYHELGGLEVLTRVVDDTLALALADDRIKDTFKNSDMKRLARTITEQFCQLSGGPCQYSGDPMKEVHQGLALSNMQFNALVEDLQMAMDKSNIASRVQNRLLAMLAPMQRVIVTR
jgi:hemoglobin